MIVSPAPSIPGMTLEQAWDLKETLIDFVLDAEGELAVALETYSAEQARRQTQNLIQREQMIDAFLTEGSVGDRSPIECFLAEHPDLTGAERDLLQRWQHSFIGLFAIIHNLPDDLRLMNWLTAKHYSVKPGSAKMATELERLQPGEILLGRITPLSDQTWMFSSPYLQLGKLGKPKLAVAIGNFKDNYRASLYSDAPELLEQAWQSVESYHQEFVEFFGNAEITLSGYELSKKLAEFQERLTERQLQKAGIDPDKSLAETVAEAGMDEAEMAEIAETLGVDAQAATNLLQSRESARMVTPKIELPPELKKAEQVTVLAHPRWGQVFLPQHSRLKTWLESTEVWDEKGTRLLLHYLKEPTITAFVWEQLVTAYPERLEQGLQIALDRPEFSLKQDLEALLKEYQKPLQPELPDIASVPQHLNDLFQAALAEVSKDKAKAKNKGKGGNAKGFQRA